MKIIHPQYDIVDDVVIPNDGIAVVYPMSEFLETLTGTEEEKLIYIANKDLPTGTKYEIIEDDDFDFSDRSFRNAWEYVAGASEKTSEDISLEDQLKYNKITQEYYDANAG